ncbi:MAG: glycosyltransferase [Methanothrix sp.]
MEVFQEGIKSYPQDPTRFFEFSRFNKMCSEFILIEGFIDFRYLEKIKNKRIVYLEFEEPNRFFVSDRLFNHCDYEDYFYKIYTICPHTAKWLNHKYNNNKRSPIFFPFNKKYVPKNNEKMYDVIYTGHIVSKNIEDIIKVISNYNYRFVSNSNHNLVTNKSASYVEKLDLMSKTKICIIQNLLYPNQNHISNVRKFEGYEDNEAFIQVPRKSTFDFISKLRKNKEIIVPHIKSRCFEAAFSRSLLLVRKDPFNIIERFFEPNREFIYYEPNSLKEKLNEILNDYDSYIKITENAYRKAMNEYTTTAFFEKYLKNLD